MRTEENTDGPVAVEVDTSGCEITVTTCASAVRASAQLIPAFRGDQQQAQERIDQTTVVTGEQFAIQIPKPRDNVSGQVRLNIVVPEGSSLTVRLGRGAVRQRGTVTAADIAVTNGSSYIGHVTGELNATNMLGYLSIYRADSPVNVSSLGGTISARDLRQGGTLQGGTRPVRAALTGPYPLEVSTATGDVDVITTPYDPTYLRCSTRGSTAINGELVERESDV